jgi:hypothetical protein
MDNTLNPLFLTQMEEPFVFKDGLEKIQTELKQLRAMHLGLIRIGLQSHLKVGKCICKTNL